MLWLVFELTRSTVWLGVVGMACQIPALFLTPIAGCIIDRFDRRRLLYATQTIAMVQAFILAWLSLAGLIEAWHIVVAELHPGAANAFDIPTRQSLLSELVGPVPRDSGIIGDLAAARRPATSDLANAIAINSSVFNGARLVGPALAGVLLIFTSPGFCFLVNGLSYMAVLAVLWAMRLSPRQRATSHITLLGGLREGLVYAWQSVPIRTLLLLIGSFNMAGMAETTLLPVISKLVLGGDASTLALLSASAGLGAFFAALFLALRRSVTDLGKWVAAAPLIYGLAMSVFSFATTLAMAATLLAFTGFALLLMTAAANTILQTIVAEDKRGRVVSLYTTMVTGLAPLGGLLAGFLAERVGAALTLRLIGLLCFTMALVFAVMPRRTKRRTFASYYVSMPCETRAEVPVKSVGQIANSAV